MSEPKALPNVVRAQAEAVLSLVDSFCQRYLDAEYKRLCRKLIEKLARKRPSPLARGDAKIWAGGAIYVVGRQNFLFDPSMRPHMTVEQISKGVGVPKSTLGNKAALICRTLRITRLTYDYHRREMLAQDPLPWMIEVNGILMDARQAPPEVQAELRRRGIIPDVDLPQESDPPAGEKKPVRAVEKRSVREDSCGLCGKSKKLTTTECCGRPICDDEENYVMFSYARNSCFRNHRRYTLCAHHHNEGHGGRWQDCGTCRKDFDTEMYVYYGTNECNFEKLEDPPAFEPTRCAKCGAVIKLSEGGYSQGPEGYLCSDCTEKKFGKLP